MIKKCFLGLVWLIPFCLISCQKTETENHDRPLDYIFYLDPSSSIHPDTVFSTYTNAFNELKDADGSVEMRQVLPQHIYQTGLFNQLQTNPKITLSALPSVLEKYHQDRFATFIDNKHQENLNVSLPSALPMSLYLAGNQIILNSDTKIAGSLQIGVDLKKISLFVGMRFEYAENIIPTKVSMNGHVTVPSCLLVNANMFIKEGGLSFGKKAFTKGLLILKQLEVYNSHIFAHQLFTHPKATLSFYGDSSIECEKKCKIKSIIQLEPENQCFASESSVSANNSLVKLKNVEFKPAVISYKLNPQENKGYFQVDGIVDLSKTTLKIILVIPKIAEEIIGKRIMVLSSTQPIQGMPKVESEFYDHEAKHRYDISFKKEGNKAYLLVSKKRPFNP